MAKQTGVLKFIGKIGSMVYYYHKYFGYLVRSVTSVDAERIRTDPAFDRVRENNADFAHGAWVVSLIRAAFLPLFQEIADTRMTSRLTSKVLAVIRASTNHSPGQRRFEDTNLEMLKGFEFNLHASLDNLRVARRAVTLDYTSERCTLTLSRENLRLLRAPKGATHVRFVMGIGSIDVETGHYALNAVCPAEISLAEKASVPLIITGSLPRGRSSHVFVTLGVSFLQAVNDDLVLLKGTSHNSLALVHVEAMPVSGKPDKKLLRPFRAAYRVVCLPRPALSLQPGLFCCALSGLGGSGQWPRGMYYNRNVYKYTDYNLAFGGQERPLPNLALVSGGAASC